MKAVIHEPLGDVFGGHAFEVAQIEDALVRDEAAVAAVERREIFLQPLGDVIRIENGDLRGFSQSSGAHRGDVNPGDGQNARAAPRRGGDGADGI